MLQRCVTYTPRMLLIDHKNALRHLSADGGLYPDQTSLVSALAEEEHAFSEQDTLWEPERIEVIKNAPVEKPQYQQDLEKASETVDEAQYDFRNTVKTWSDFMYTRYHPRSINLLQTVDESSEDLPFDCYSRGTQAWREEYFDDEFCDRIRLYIEECNNCQGFQTLFDCCDAYSGLSIKVLEHLQDDYGKSCLTIPIFTPNQTKYGVNVNEAMADSVRVINTALTYGNLIEFSSMILPLSTMSRCWRKVTAPRQFSQFNYDPHSLYETSAILATYLDTISLRYRVRESIDSCNLASFCSDLTNYGRKLVAAGLEMPFQMLADEELIECLDRFEGKLFTQLSPNSNVGTDRIVQSVSVRGIPKDRLKSTKPKKMEKQRKMAAYSCDSVAEMFQLYFQCNNYSSLAHVSALQNGMPTRKPFPVEFFDHLTLNGFINEFASGEENKASKLRSIPVMATAQCSNDLSDTLETLHREAKRIKIAKIPRFGETGLESDDYEDVLEKILEFKDNYEEAFEL